LYGTVAEAAVGAVGAVAAVGAVGAEAAVGAVGAVGDNRSSGFQPMALVELESVLHGKRRTMVPSFQLSTLLKAHGIDKVDYLAIDRVPCDKVLATIDLDEIKVAVLDLWNPPPHLISRLETMYDIRKTIGEQILMTRKLDEPAELSE